MIGGGETGIDSGPLNFCAAIGVPDACLSEIFHGPVFPMITRLHVFGLLSLLLVVVGGCEESREVKNESGNAEVRPSVNDYVTQPARIYVDEKDNDWEEVSARHDDADDGDGLDIERL